MEYAGAELAAMAEARNYYAWILSECRPRLGRIVLEHGAGIGTFSDFLLRDPSLERLFAVEPSLNLVPHLRARLSAWGRRAEVVAATLEESLSQLRNRGIDTVVSLNVLEHIEDDRSALRAMADVLPPGGGLILLVPAVPWLYGSLDAAFEHFRRYARSELVEKVEGAGLTVDSVRFLNLPGLLSWFAVGRVLRRRTLSPGAVRFYDRFILPAVLRLERLLPPPIGQNLLLIARRPAAA